MHKLITHTVFALLLLSLLTCSEPVPDFDWTGIRSEIKDSVLVIAKDGRITSGVDSLKILYTFHKSKKWGYINKLQYD